MADRKGLGFPKQLRLRKRQEFLDLRNVGQKIRTAHFIILLRKNTDRPTRLGLTASRKTGRAVQRNRAKRLVREFFRTRYEHLPPQMDVSVIVRRGAAQLDFSEVCDELSVLIPSRESGRVPCPGNSPLA